MSRLKEILYFFVWRISQLNVVDIICPMFPLIFPTNGIGSSCSPTVISSRWKDLNWIEYKLGTPSEHSLIWMQCWPALVLSLVKETHSFCLVELSYSEVFLFPYYLTAFPFLLNETNTFRISIKCLLQTVDSNRCQDLNWSSTNLEHPVKHSLVWMHNLASSLVLHLGTLGFQIMRLSKSLIKHSSTGLIFVLRNIMNVCYWHFLNWCQNGFLEVCQTLT